MSKTKLLLLYGGKSGEHEISLISAASVLRNLDANKYHIIPVAMDKEGCFYQNEYQELLAYEKSLPVATVNSRALSNFFVGGGLAIEPDVIFPVVHGPLYEDGCLQGLFELASIPYVGCDVLASAIGMDKDISRQLVSLEGISFARYRVLSWHAAPAEKELFCQQVVNELGWPLFVKPCSLGSSVGTHKVKSIAELRNAIADALRYDECILVEEFIAGREIELAVLENSLPCAPPRVSEVGEICVNHPDGFYSYTAKYLESGQTQLHIPASLDEKISSQLKTAAGQIFTRLKCKGMARVDFFVNEEDGSIYFNEINTLPGFTAISMYPKLWQTSGLSYPDLLDELINLAMIHQRCRQQLVTSYQ